MAIVIREIHAATSPEALNEEWFLLENTGEKPFSTAGCAVATGRGPNSRLSQQGTLDPGFTLAPNAKVRVISGNPGKKIHGKPPEEKGEVRNYHLFLGSPLLAGAGTVLAMSLKQHEVVRATFDPEGKAGLGAA